MAVVDLDSPPDWWHEQAGDHMTADEARAFAGTDGTRPHITSSSLLSTNADCLLHQHLR